MSGRSGYRKTDRKRNRHARPAPKLDYVLRFQLPRLIAAFLAPGKHGWGVAIGFNDTVFVEGRTPAHCCDLAADFFENIKARQTPIQINGHVVRLLPCSGHASPASEGFKKLSIDLEAVHDRVSRFADQSRAISIDIGADAITFAGKDGWNFRAVHPGGDRKQA